MTEYVSTLWLIFSFSFLVALTGAMAPGPLLTYTIIQSVRAKRHGYLMGGWIIAGHAILEMGIVLFLLLGFSFVLKNILVVWGIGVIGGLILVCFGVSILRDIFLRNISTGIVDASDESEPVQRSDGGKMGRAIVGGITVSMSNPYWWVWWATIGLAFMTQFDITFKDWPRLLAFFIGHEAGDLLWYLFVSSLAYFGLRRMNRKVYYGILFVCAAFMIGFGLYLGISPFINPL